MAGPGENECDHVLTIWMKERWFELHLERGEWVIRWLRERIIETNVDVRVTLKCETSAELTNVNFAANTPPS